jgi:hypothetical protein
MTFHFKQQLTEVDYMEAEDNGISRNVLYLRYYNYDYDLERAKTEPVGTYKRITTNMKHWEEWKDVAEKNGIEKQIFYNRLNAKSRKWTPEEAATVTKGARKNITIDPKVYALAEKNGIKKATLRNRVFNLHWNPVRAATEGVKVLVEGVLV